MTNGIHYSSCSTWCSLCLCVWKVYTDDLDLSDGEDSDFRKACKLSLLGLSAAATCLADNVVVDNYSVV